jgi:hypothetical protein
MPKFDELLQAYVAARHDFFTRRDASVAAAASVFSALETYLGSPRFALHFQLSSGDSSTNRSLKPEEAVRFDPDGTWRFGVGLDLNESVGGFRKDVASQTLALDVVLAPAGEGFSLGLRGSKERFNVPLVVKPGDCTPFCEFVYGRMLASYQQPGQSFFEGASASRRTIS